MLIGMHLSLGPSYADAVEIAAGAGEDLYLAWDESDDDRPRRTRVVRVHPCAVDESPIVLPPRRPRSSYWPQTVDGAVDEILSKMDAESKARVGKMPREDLIQFHLGWGMGIRNRYGLWKGNAALLESCGGKKMHPEHCSMIIIERVWERLQQAPEQ